MNMKRMRGRNHRPNGGGNGGGGGFRNQQNGIPLNRNHVFDSSGPEMRLRGTAQQLHEKYIQLARDASSNGDRVTGEAYYQHAEHYFRIISAINQAQNPNGQPNPNGMQAGQQNGQGNGYQGNGSGNGDYDRRQDFGEQVNGMEPRQAEARPAEPRPDQRAPEPRYQEPRYQEPRYQEPRQQEPRYQEPRQEPRAQEPRQQDRPNEPRRHERPYEPRHKPEFPRAERYRSENPIADAPIDISSALEAELAAATAEPAGLREQPAVAPPPVPPQESRAIPIVSEAPPPAEAPRVPRPRGRPRLVRPDAAEKPATDK